MVPDRLPEALREVIVRFPPGALQFEVGVQTFHVPTAERISRRQNYAKLEENLRWLRAHTGVHLHADLIAGLPGESLGQFGSGFDRLVALEPQEIQVGILKRLRGTPIVRHDAAWQMVYNPHAPYEILQNGLLDFATMQRLRRFARYWDLVGNSGNFLETTRLIWSAQEAPTASGSEYRESGSDPQPAEARTAPGSPFHSFLRWSDWLFQRIGRTDSIALARLAEHLFTYLTTEAGLNPRDVAETLWRDYLRGGRPDQPEFLRPHLTSRAPAGGQARERIASQKRQARHLA
jgi:hypothetical protein